VTGLFARANRHRRFGQGGGPTFRAQATRMALVCRFFARGAQFSVADTISPVPRPGISLSTT
jgi:hypothetical protein